MGASQPSRTTGTIFLYIYIHLYIYPGTAHTVTFYVLLNMRYMRKMHAHSRSKYTTNAILHHAVIEMSRRSARRPVSCRLSHVHASTQRAHAASQRVHASTQRAHAASQRVHAGSQRVYAGCQFSPTSSWCGLGPSVRNVKSMFYAAIISWITPTRQTFTAFTY